jgi:hypothetical protein
LDSISAAFVFEFLEAIVQAIPPPKANATIAIIASIIFLFSV